MSAIDSNFPHLQGKIAQLMRLTAYYTRKADHTRSATRPCHVRRCSAVPLMIGDRLGLSKEAIAMPLARISFAAGSSHYCNVSVSSLYGDPPAGDYVGDLCCCNTMIAIGMNPDIGLLGIFGATTPRVLSPHY